MSTKDDLKNSKIGQFWLKYEKKIILASGIILIAAVSFEAGFLKGKKNPQEAVIVKQAACAPCPEENKISDEKESRTSNETNIAKSLVAVQSTEQSTVEKQTCTFVASKNSNKYHLASCQWAARIKPENKICFSSAEEAEKRGYQRAKCCIK